MSKEVNFHTAMVLCDSNDKFVGLVYSSFYFCGVPVHKKECD